MYCGPMTHTELLNVLEILIIIINIANLSVKITVNRIVEI